MALINTRDKLGADISKVNSQQDSLVNMANRGFAEKLIENSAVATFVLDHRHTVLTWNTACQELTGIPASKMIGTDNHWKAFYPYKRPCLADVIIDGDVNRLSDLYSVYAKSTLNPNSLHAEGWYPNLNKKDRYILFDAAAICDSEGNLIAAIETLQDITERTLAEEALKRNEENFKQLLERIPVAIAVADKVGNLTFFNNKFIETFGYTLEEIPSVDDWWPLAYPNEEYRAKVINSWRMAASKARRDGKETESREWRVTCKNGDVRDIEFRMASIKDKNIVIFHDLTERKTLEQQLIQAQKMEAVGQLAGGVAHDFNNILSAIMGYSSLVQMRTKEDMTRDYASQIVAVSGRAANLTRSLLAFSRKQAMDQKPTDINDIVQTTTKLLMRLIGEHIELITMLTEESIVSFVDRGQIEQVLVNLATNARDAMPSGGILTLSTKLTELDTEFIKIHGYGEIGKFALLSVTDTGIGMDEKTRVRIFEPFFTTKDVGKGTGLGLAMAYGIIKQHKGFINVYSELGEGTIFRIYLPAIQLRAEEAETKEQISLKGGSETILLAEDNAEVRAVTQAVLEQFGYTVIVADDGQDAINKFSEHSNKIDLLIADVIMPKKNGKEAYMEIRSMRPRIKAIFTSGYTAETLQKQGLLEKGLRSLSKPISLRQLLQEVRAILDK